MIALIWSKVKIYGYAILGILLALLFAKVKAEQAQVAKEKEKYALHKAKASRAREKQIVESQKAMEAARKAGDEIIREAEHASDDAGWNDRFN